MKKTVSKIKKQEITFSLEDAGAQSVFVLGDFNDWDETSLPLKKNKKGTWERKIKLEPGRYEYKFMVDGNWRIDINNSQLSQNNFGTTNNVLTVVPA